MKVHDRVIYDLIRERRALREQPGDLLGMLIDARDADTGQGMTDDELRREISVMMFAGHETTAVTLTWALYLLSQNRGAEQALLDELRGTLGDRLPQPEDMDRLGCTSRVVKEAMRLYPPAFVLARRAGRDTTIGRYVVPRGSEVVVWIYFTHRDPRYYPDPEAFRPERFEAAAEAARPKQSYLPFGAGPRACIGRAVAAAEATLLLACLYQRFTFRYAQAAPPKPRARITLAPAGGLKMIPQARPKA
jgi:cytochrome P450